MKMFKGFFYTEKKNLNLENIHNNHKKFFFLVKRFMIKITLINFPFLDFIFSSKSLSRPGLFHLEWILLNLTPQLPVK